MRQPSACGAWSIDAEVPRPSSGPYPCPTLHPPLPPLTQGLQEVWPAATLQAPCPKPTPPPPPSTPAAPWGLGRGQRHQGQSYRSRPGALTIMWACLGQQVRTCDVRTSLLSACHDPKHLCFPCLAMFPHLGGQGSVLADTHLFTLCLG